VHVCMSVCVSVCVYLGYVPEVEEVVYLGGRGQESGDHGVVQLHLFVVERQAEGGGARDLPAQAQAQHPPQRQAQAQPVVPGATAQGSNTLVLRRAADSLVCCETRRYPSTVGLQHLQHALHYVSASVLHVCSIPLSRNILQYLVFPPAL